MIGRRVLAGLATIVLAGLALIRPAETQLLTAMPPLPCGGAGWSFSDKNSHFTISSCGLVAANSDGSADDSLRGNTSHGSGKNYIEFRLSGGTLNNIGVGVANSTASLSAYIGSDANGIVAFRNGQVFYNGASLGNFASATAIAGDVIGVAVDNGAGKFWARLNGGNWNDNVANDPASGTGGYSFSWVGADYPAATVGTGTLTLNLGASAFAFTAPSGFSAW